MKPHLIVLDLDGTLLNDAKIITAKTKDIIAKAQSAGHHVMIATGRPYRASDIYYHELNLTTPIINFNGAYIHHPKNQCWQTIHRPIDLQVVREVVHSIDQFPYQNLIAEIIDDVYIHTEDQNVLKIFKMGNPRITLGNISENLKDNPTSLLIQAKEVYIPAIRNHLQQLHAEVIEHRRWGEPFPVIEVVRRGLNKAIGVSYVAKELHIPRERIIAFGDEDNDLEMIEFAGVGVAMGNAIHNVKNIANDITLTNNEDGIVNILQERLKL